MIFIRQKTKRRGKMEDRHLTEVLTELKRRALLTELALSLAPRREPLSTGDTPPYAVFPARQISEKMPCGSLISLISRRLCSSSRRF